MIKNHKLIKSLIFLVLFFCNSQIQAAQSPRFLGSEKKFRAYIYNPNDVYRYVGHYNYQGFIEFDGTESISTISMGDSSSWLFEHLGNRLFLKPVADNADTNMTVITNKKIYHFELVAKEAKGINDPDLIFVVKFVYPDEKDKNILEFPKVQTSDEPDMRNLNIYNFNYEFTGDPSLAPIKVFDNGEFTYFQFLAKSAELPAVFSVDSAGFESLVNFRSAGDYIVVERVAPQFTLRNGNEIVCVYNNSMLKTGKYLPSGQKRPKTDKLKNDMPLSFDNAMPFDGKQGNRSPLVKTQPLAPQNYPANSGFQNLNTAGSGFQGNPQAYGTYNPSMSVPPFEGAGSSSYQSMPPYSSVPAAPNYGSPNANHFAAPYPEVPQYSQPSRVRQGGFVTPENFDMMDNQNSGGFVPGAKSGLLQ